MTKSHANAPVVIIGAGLAGLTSAIYLRRQGIPVQVFEPSPHLAGLARSFESGDGFTYDFGVFVNMRFEGRGLLPDVVVWTPGKDFPFFRITETPLSNGQCWWQAQCR